MSEWKEYKLGDIVNFSSGGTPSKSDERFWGGNIPWISASSMEGYTYSDSTLRITELGLKNGSRLAPKNSILLLVRGSILHQKLQVGIVERDVSFNQDVKCLQPNEEIIDPWFLLFWFKSEEKNLLNKVESTGIGAGKLDTPVLKDLLIKVPPIHERNKLNEIFKAIQSKIELNRQMNQTLEAMAQALFKSWFVDFDPVMDNALSAGNDIPDELLLMTEKRQLVPASKKLITTNPDLAAKFPSSFVFNEILGKWIPEGWEDVNLGKLIKIKHGYAFKGEFFSDEPTNDVLLTPGNFKIGGGIKLEKLKYYDGVVPEDYILKKGDLIITMTDLSKEGDTLGFPALVPQNDKLNFLHNQRLGKVEYLSNKIGGKFLYHCLCDREYRFVIVGSASGTTVKHTSPSKILLHNILFSGGELEASFENIINANFEKVETNNLETETLIQLRDRLLPELISGKVRLADAEEHLKY